MSNRTLSFYWPVPWREYVQSREVAFTARRIKGGIRCMGETPHICEWCIYVPEQSSIKIPSKLHEVPVEFDQTSRQIPQILLNPCFVSRVPGFDNTQYHRAYCEYHWKDASASS